MNNEKITALEQQIAQLAQEVAALKRQNETTFSTETAEEYLLGVYNDDSCTHK